MSEKIAVITGAGSGVGRAVAKALNAAGWSLALVGRRKDALEETAAMCKKARVICVPTDVTVPEQVAHLFATVKKEFGRLDCLFNNAGAGNPATNFGDFTWDMWRSTVAVNLDAMFLVANGAYRLMRDQTPQGGRIINNGSISAHAPRPGSVAYTASKHAVTGLTKTISLDGRAYNIACGQVDIGNAVTPMTDPGAKNGQMQPNGQIMVEPRMDVDHVGQQVAFMADLPLESNVQFVTIMATKMPLVGRG
jgi:NAD(P)-dependent dehydrogenase (short-subunit alcohol dehydrogenase family)